MPNHACIALGSNLGDRHAHIRAALDALAALPRTTLLAASSIHETDPVGPVTQGRFLNAAAAIDTSLPPRELLDRLLAIEQSRGRDRSAEQRWGPRTLDLDLLLYGSLVINEPGLVIPHPRLHERRFVLEPLAEIAAETLVPGHATISQLLARLRSDPAH